MTKEERVKHLESKAQELMDWFVQKPPPVGRFQLNGWVIVEDVRKYFTAQIDRIKANKGNPYNTIYINAYFSLSDLKKYMEERVKGIPAIPVKEKIIFSNGRVNNSD